MATSIDMASNALILIGDNPISSFNDPGAGAQAAAALYQDTYKSILSEHPWTFALKEQPLSKLTQTPEDVTGYSNAFRLPPDMIRIWKIMPHSNYAIIGDIVYSNENSLFCRYNYGVEEVELPPQLVKAVEYKLASDFAMLITEDINKADYYENKYLRQLSLARSVDSQGHPQVPIIDSPFVDVRLTGGTYGGSFY